MESMEMLELNRWSRELILDGLDRASVINGSALPCDLPLLKCIPEKVLKELCLSWCGTGTGGVEFYRLDLKKAELLTEKRVRKLLKKLGITERNSYEVA